MVAGHDEDIRSERLNSRDHGVKFFSPFDLGRKVTILASGISVFEVQEEEVVVIPAGGKLIDLFAEGLRLADQVHTDKTRQPLVHRIDRDGSRSEAIEFFVRGQSRLGREAAEGQAVGLGFIAEKFSGLSYKFFSHLGCCGGRRIEWLWVKWCHTNSLGVGVCHSTIQSGAAEDHHKTMLLHRFDEDFIAIDCDSLKFFDDLKTLFRRDAACSSVTDQAGSVERAEIPTGSDILRSQFKTDAGCFERTPADFEFEWVVPEQAKVTWP